MENPTNPTDWLRYRAIGEETETRMGIKTATDGEPRVAFPYLDRAGNLIGHKVRAISGKRFWFNPKGAARDLFNLAALYEAETLDEPIIITEGEIDCAAIVEAGFNRVVSIPDGWTDGMTAGDTPKLKPILDNLDGFRVSPYCIFAGDNDSTGRSFMKAFQNAMDDHPVKVCRWPDGCKDANDVLMEHGPSILVSVINAARPIDPEGGRITGLDDLPPMPDRTILNSGNPYLDEVFRLEMGTVSVLTGIPNHGKSTMCVWMLRECAKHNETRVGSIMFETHAYQLREQLCRNEIGKPYHWDDPKCIEAARAASVYWHVVHPQEEDGIPFDMLWIKTMIRNLAIYHDCKIILIDPWNEIEHSMDKGETETMYTRDALKALRRWAKRYDVAVVIVAHPKKMDPKENRPVQGYDIAGSSTWYDKAFMGWTVQLFESNDGNETTTLHCWKVKDRSAYGIRPASADFIFHPQTMLFSPAGWVGEVSAK